MILSADADFDYDVEKRTVRWTRRGVFYDRIETVYRSVTRLNDITDPEAIHAMLMQCNSRWRVRRTHDRDVIVLLVPSGMDVLVRNLAVVPAMSW